ncbi:hypothetical protein BC829DRAFT_444525 [Chytridium lagenaria]|nr:hypothetical protein BC829DRAFT_444525 [Chytridium lagenaria]
MRHNLDHNCYADIARSAGIPSTKPTSHASVPAGVALCPAGDVDADWGDDGTMGRVMRWWVCDVDDGVCEGGGVDEFGEDPAHWVPGTAVREEGRYAVLRGWDAGVLFAVVEDVREQCRQRRGLGRSLKGCPLMKFNSSARHVLFTQLEPMFVELWTYSNKTTVEILGGHTDSLQLVDMLCSEKHLNTPCGLNQKRLSKFIATNTFIPPDLLQTLLTSSKELVDSLSRKMKLPSITDLEILSGNPKLNNHLKDPCVMKKLTKLREGGTTSILGRKGGCRVRKNGVTVFGKVESASEVRAERATRRGERGGFTALHMTIWKRSSSEASNQELHSWDGLGFILVNTPLFILISDVIRAAFPLFAQLQSLLHSQLLEFEAKNPVVGRAGHLGLVIPGNLFGG